MEQDNKDTKKKKHNKKKIRRNILISLLILFLLISSAGAGIIIAVVKSAPVIDPDILSNLKESSKIYDKDGNYIEDLAEAEKRNIVPLSEIPEHLQNAFIAIEDERFKEHPGVDVKRMFGALWHDIKTMSLQQGASTITQQLIKNYALTMDKKFTRKFQEMYLALQLEKKLSKDQILEAYLNTINLGGNKYGVQAASLFYFGKSAKELDIAESALVAGITQNPTKYYPFSEKNKKDPKDYLDRQKTVLSKMLELKFITKEQYDQAINEKLNFRTVETASSMKYQWFIEPAIDQVAADLAEKFSISEKEAKQKLRSGGLNIFLTIDPKLQDIAQNAIDNPNYYKGLGISEKNKMYSPDNKSEPKIQPQAAAAFFDYKTGEMRAIIGGRGQFNLRSLNRATQVPRQPGSSIKPLAVYGPAVDTQLVGAGSSVDDSALTGDELKAFGGKSPKNADGKFLGEITVREAIKQSRNLVAVKLGFKVGSKTALDYLQNKFHLSTVVTKGGTNDAGLAAFALGGMTHGVYPYEMAAAYGVFGNNGMYSDPIMYTKVTDRKGNTVLEKTSSQSKALSPQAAYIMVDMMKDVVRGGTGTNARLGSMPSAGKTGTANDNTNAWFCGLTPYYSGAVWVGHDSPNIGINKMYSSLSAKIWGDIMREAHKGLAVKDFVRPSGINSISICADSGKAPTDLCAQDPRGSRVKTDLFISGSKPVELCDIHIKVRIDSKTGKLASANCPAEDIKEIVVLQRDGKYYIPGSETPLEECTDPHTKPVVTPPVTPPVTPDPGKPDKPKDPPKPPTTN